MRIFSYFIVSYNLLFALNLNTICLTLSDPHSREDAGARPARGTIYRYTIQHYIDRFALVVHAPHDVSHVASFD